MTCGRTPPMVVQEAVIVTGQRPSRGRLLLGDVLRRRAVVCQPAGWSGRATASGRAVGTRGAAVAGTGLHGAGRGTAASPRL